MSLLDAPQRAATTTSIPPFNATIFSATAAVSVGVDNLLDYTDWGFQVTVSGGDSLKIQPSFDGGTLSDAPLFMNMKDGSIVASASGITVTGYYRPVILTATSTYALLKPFQTRSWFVTKTGTAAAASVIACGGWAA